MQRLKSSYVWAMILVLFACGEGSTPASPELFEPEVPELPACAAYDGNKGTDIGACNDVAKYNDGKGCGVACAADGEFPAQAVYDAQANTCTIVCDKPPPVECPDGATPQGTLYLFPKVNGPTDYTPLQCVARGFDTIVCLATNQLSEESGAQTCLDLEKSSDASPTTAQWDGCKKAFPQSNIELGMIINQGAPCINPYVDDPGKYVTDLEASASAVQVELSWFAVDKEKGGGGSRCIDDGTTSSCKEELIQAMQATGAKLAYAKNPNDGTCPASDASACVGYTWLGLNEEYTSNQDIDDCWENDFVPNDPGNDAFVDCLKATQSYSAAGTAPLLCLASPSEIPQGECQVGEIKEYFQASKLTWQIVDEFRGGDGGVGFYIPTPSLD